MRILYFAFVELDVPNACQTHTLGVLRGFGSHGCSVDAIVPRPVRVRPEIPNVRFHYLWPWQFTALGRAWVKLASFASMCILCLQHQYNAIYVREMERNPGPRFCSRLFGIPLFIEINDLIPLTLSREGVSKSLLGKVVRNQQCDLWQSAGLIVPSVPMIDWIIDRYGIPAQRAHLVLHGADPPDSIEPDRSRARKRLGLPDRCFCLGYLGLIHRGYDFDTMLQAFEICRKEIPILYLVFIGDGPMSDEVKRKAGRLGLNNRVFFAGYIQPEHLGAVMPAIDIGLQIATKETAAQFGPTATKMATYALYRLLVLATGFSLKGYPEELQQSVCLIPPQNPQALSDRISWMYRHRDEMARIAANLHDFVAHRLTWHCVSRQIIDIMENTAEGQC